MRAIHRLAPLTVLILTAHLEPAAVQAAADAAPETAANTSRLTGIALPAGAERIEDADTAAQVLAQLNAMAEKSKSRPQPEVCPGQAGRHIRPKLVVEAVTAKLKEAGWQYEAEAASPSELGPVTTFVGIHEARAAGFIGFWVDNEQMLLLAWADVVAAASAAPPPSATPTPEIPAEGPPLATELPRLPKLEAKRGYVRGRVVNMRGEPLPNAAIVIYGTTFDGGQRQSYTITARDGRYEMEVPDGLYGVSATTKVHYHDADYKLHLFPMDSSAEGEKWNSKSGIVMDFALKLTGYSSKFEVMGADFHGSYNGGWMGLHQNRDEVIAGELPEGLVMVTLTPLTPLIDGSISGVRQIQVDFGKVFTGAWYDIPIGRYRVSATITTKADGKTYGLTVEVRTRASDPATTRAATADFDFAPRSGNEPGTEEVRLVLRP